MACVTFGVIRSGLKVLGLPGTRLMKRIFYIISQLRPVDSGTQVLSIRERMFYQLVQVSGILRCLGLIEHMTVLLKYRHMVLLKYQTSRGRNGYAGVAGCLSQF